MPFLVFILLLFAIVAAALLVPMLMLATLVAIGATVYYFLKLDWEKERTNGLISLALLIVVNLILVGVYTKFGLAGVAVGIFLILVFVGSTS